MDSVDIEVLRTAEQWRKGGRKVALGTIVKTWGSAPRPVGAMVAIRDDGQVVGSVSGGCVEDDLMDKAREKLPAWTKPELFTYGVTNEEATRWGLPCGGTLQLVMEPLSIERIGELLDGVSQQQLVRRDSRWTAARRRLSQDAGRTCSSSTAACSPPCTARAGDWCSSAPASLRAISPRWRACSTTTSWSSTRARSTPRAGTSRRCRSTAACPTTWCASSSSTVTARLVALTHDPKLDDLALMEAPAVAVWARSARRRTTTRARAAARVRRLRRGDRAPARTGGALHRLEDPARDRGCDPCRDDRGAPRRERAELGREARTALRSIRL